MSGRPYDHAGLCLRKVWLAFTTAEHRPTLRFLPLPFPQATGSRHQSSCDPFQERCSRGTAGFPQGHPPPHPGAQRQIGSGIHFLQQISCRRGENSICREALSQNPAGREAPCHRPGGREGMEEVGVGICWQRPGALKLKGSPPGHLERHRERRSKWAKIKRKLPESMAWNNSRPQPLQCDFDSPIITLN